MRDSYRYFALAGKVTVRRLTRVAWSRKANASREPLPLLIHFRIL